MEEEKEDGDGGDEMEATEEGNADTQTRDGYSAMS